MVNRIAIEEWCAAGFLPQQSDFLEALVDDGATFTATEGQHWDFKEQWPFSYSDSYFGGIARLICAFSNTFGGIIVFGVNDETRIGGKNKVRVNLDKLMLSFEQLTGAKFGYDFKTFLCPGGIDQVNVLLIKPRPRNLRPFVFKRKIENYDEGIIWVRSGNEVVRAQPQHYAHLFLSEDASGVEGSIPPSTAQIKRFIGRVEAMVELFDWLQNSDEPRTYLYGKGGSGKTTIAREFSKLVKASGGELRIEGIDKVDIVIFLSAKERELITMDAEISTIEEPDFYDENSLLQKIILHSGGETDTQSEKEDKRQKLRGILSEYFDLFSYLIVIDDIDTLTTKGIDPGADFLFRTLSRAKKRSKILYTTRNAPSQSIVNSIEVPGLVGEEYLQFVGECVARFKTPEPDKDFRDNKLPVLSERRPLVIESIIALARTSGGFQGAERLFTQNVGDNVRDYVFSREWDSLSNGLERPLLAALADLRRPATFDDLRIVLQSNESTIRDAIGGVREMFLSIDDAGDNTLYSLAPLTRAFVNSKKSTLGLYPAVKIRVQNFKKTIKLTSPEVARVVARVRALVPLRFSTHSIDSLRNALTIVRSPDLSESITEDPVFRALKGYVEAIQLRPDMSAVREDFLYATQMKHEPEFDELMAWFNAEKNSNTLELHLFSVMNTVISGRRYSEDEKIGMISRKATTAYHFAKQKVYSDPENAVRGFSESLLLHFRAFKLNALSGSAMLGVSEKYARNTSDQWIRMVSEVAKWEPLLAFLELQRNSDGYLDPIFMPFIFYLEKLEKGAHYAAERSRINNAAKKLLLQGFEPTKWMDTTLIPELSRAVKAVANATSAQSSN